jgi:hypothetical protein
VAIRTKETSTVNGLRVLLIDIRKDATDQQPIVIDHLLIERKSGNAITDMNPGEVYYYTLARLDDNGDILCGPFKRRHPYKLPYTPALLKVRVSAQGMSTLAQFYRIDKSASGELQFAPIGLSG